MTDNKVISNDTTLLTLAEVAAYLKVAEKTVSRMLQRGEIPAGLAGRGGAAESAPGAHAARGAGGADRVRATRQVRRNAAARLRARAVDGEGRCN
jgi:excisionase family DNA binding protein